MFSALFSSTLNKIFIGVLLVILLMLAYFYKSNSDKAERLQALQVSVSMQKNSIQEQQATIDEQNKRIVLMQQVTKFDDETRQDLMNKVDDLGKKDDLAKQQSNKKIVVIQRRYADLPQTSGNDDKRDQEISTERIGNLRTLYCNANPTGSDCVSEAAASGVSKP